MGLSPCLIDNIHHEKQVDSHKGKLSAVSFAVNASLDPTMSSVLNENEKTSTPAGTSRTTDNLSSLPTDKNDDSEEEFYFGVDLLHKMDIDDITHLRVYFFDENKIPKHKRKDAGSCGVSLNRTEFIDAMQTVAGNTSLAGAAGKLFDYFDVNSLGTITWDQILDGFLENTEPVMDTARNTWNPIDPDVKIHSAAHCKREPIVKIVSIETKSAFCYAVVSKFGKVGVYDGEFTLLDSYKMALKPCEETLREFDTDKEQKQRRSQTTWVADLVYIADSNSLLFASSDRSLHLYDANCLIHIPLCRIMGLQNVPTCLEYYASQVSGQPSLLFIGDDTGGIITMKFHQARTSLFKKKHPDKLDNYYWSELREQIDYVTYSTQAGIHNDLVTQMAYCPSNETILSCSSDPTNTLVVRHIDGRRQPYIFKVTRGIKCFHYERSMHIIATGSNDFVVRMWNEVVTKQPVISLYGHKAPVVDVRIIKYMSAIMSLSKEGVVKVWDVNDYYCQMTLPLQFPILKVVGARVDFGIQSIYPGPKTVKEVSNESSGLKEQSSASVISATHNGDIETQISGVNLDKREESHWKRRNLVIACSNFIAVLRLTPSTYDAIQNDLADINAAFLPPPPKEHYASAPSPWKTAESYTKTPDASVESGSTGLSSGSSSTLGLTAKKPQSSKHAKKYQNFTADVVKSPMDNMNTKRTGYLIRQEQLKMLVEQCAPHLALDLHELEPVKFSKPLPITRNMKERGIDVSDPERVVKAKIQKDPAIFSLGSSSAAQSPRSSKSSKTASLKKKFLPSRTGQTTPEWFTEKIQLILPDSNNDTSIPSQ